jgi:hypothetical protein
MFNSDISLVAIESYFRAQGSGVMVPPSSTHKRYHAAIRYVWGQRSKGATMCSQGTHRTHEANS